MALVTDADVKAAVAARLSTPVGNLQSQWDEIVTRANVQAYNLIRRTWAARGYTESQVDDWDDGEEFNLNLAVIFAMRNGAMANSYDQQAIDKLWDYYLAQFKETVFLVDGEQVDPEAARGRISFGDLSESRDTFTPDTKF